MELKIINNVKVYKPQVHQDLYDLEDIIDKTNETIVIDCHETKVLPSHFISNVFRKNKYVVLAELSHTSETVIEMVGADTKLLILPTVSDAVWYLQEK